MTAPATVRVDSPAPVGGIERAGYLPHHSQRIVQRHRPAKRCALHILEDEIARADVVELTDVRMVQRGDGPRFLLETAQSIRIAGEGLGKDLDRDLASQTRVTGPIHLAHPAGAEWRDD